MKLAVIMDPIAHISFHHDTTFAILLAAQKRHWQLHYMEQKDLFWHQGIAYSLTRQLTVYPHQTHQYTLSDQTPTPLIDFDIIFMRKDPPFNMNYIMTTYFLDHAEKNGVIVINSPQGLRDSNEKFITTFFPQCIPPTLISCCPRLLLAFHQQHQTVVFKPLDVMGGRGIFMAKACDNITKKIALLSKNYQKPIIAQQYLPEITTQGDKRIILIDGEVMPYALTRYPKSGNFLANMAAGGIAKACLINEHDRWICRQIAPSIKEKGLFFVGIDIIGQYLTEINVTSPTGVVEINRFFNINLCDILLDKLLIKYPKLANN